MRTGLMALIIAFSTLSARASELIYDKFTPLVQYRHTNSDNDLAQKFLVEIEKVPDPIQKLLEERDGKIVIFDGFLTTNPEFYKIKDQIPPGWSNNYTFSDLTAGYHISSKTVFLGIYRPKYEMKDPSLHEYGHCFDFIIGEYLYHKPLSKIHTIPDIIKKEPFDYHYLNRPREYIANSFELFYRGEETRKSLKENQPTIHKFLSDIESTIIKKTNAKKQQTKVYNQYPMRGIRIFRR